MCGLLCFVCCWFAVQAEHRTMAAFVLAMIVNEYQQGQVSCYQLSHISARVSLCIIFRTYLSDVSVCIKFTTDYSHVSPQTISEQILEFFFPCFL